VPEVAVVHGARAELTLEQVVDLLEFQTSRNCQQRYSCCCCHGSTSGRHRAFLANVAIGRNSRYERLRRGNPIQLRVTITQRLRDQTAIRCSPHSPLLMTSRVSMENN
jgi:hypothetical protein